MKIVRWRIPYASRSDEILIWAVGDIHWGHADCARHALANTITAIEGNPLAYWIGLGDYTDAISLKDMRYHPEALDAAYQEEPRNAREEELDDIAIKLQRIAPKCLGLLEGNHNCQKLDTARIVEPEARRLARRLNLISKHSADDTAQQGFFRANAIAEDQLLLAAFFTRDTGRNTHNTWTRLFDVGHGVQASRKPGAALARLQDIFSFQNVHVVIRGHNHYLGTWNFPRIEYCGYDFKPVSQDRIGVCSGSYLRLYVPGRSYNYAAKADYAPSAIGTGGVAVNPNEHRIRGATI